jgi:uncharacterized SAM-binding protein YcdF (DUF218 family)
MKYSSQELGTACSAGDSRGTKLPRGFVPPLQRPLRWTAIALLIAGLSLSGWLAREPLLRLAADLWIVSDPEGHGDAIVVLGGNYHVRPRVAAYLYRRGLATRVLVSETGEEWRAAWGSSPSDSQLNGAALASFGVPASAVETFGTANRNTREEAVALREWAERNGASVLIIPVEIFMARRARWILLREFSNSPMTVRVLSFDPPAYTRNDWWRIPQGVSAFRDELIKYVYYRWKY